MLFNMPCLWIVNQCEIWPQLHNILIFSLKNKNGSLSYRLKRIYNHMIKMLLFKPCNLNAGENVKSHQCVLCRYQIHW